MELVEGDVGVGQMICDALDEGRRHVDADQNGPARRYLCVRPERQTWQWTRSIYPLKDGDRPQLRGFFCPKLADDKSASA
jgi:hypothetical protein